MAQSVDSRRGIMMNLAKKEQVAAFKKKGVLIAFSSAIFYGFYTAFMTLGMAQGVWIGWEQTVNFFIFAALGAAVTDTCSAFCATVMSIIRGRFSDYLRCLKTTPGKVMVAAAIIGGPFASTCYVLGLQMAGSFVVPISALCPAIGAILGRILFKQALTPRMMVGILICFGASFMIISSSLGDVGEASNLPLGLFFGFLSACGWGIEGCICGFGTSMIDPEVAINIRQVTSGLSNLIILVPILCFILLLNQSGDGAGSSLFGNVPDTLNPLFLISTAFTDGASIKYFFFAGLCAYMTFMFWYKGTGMCGAALGMSCNGTFSFWGPFCCWLVIGEIYGLPGWGMPAEAWIAALIMVIGIFTIALNPVEIIREALKSYKSNKDQKPLNYAVLKHFTQVDEASVDDLLEILRENYGEYKAFDKSSLTTALMTAEVNGLIEESRFDLNEKGELRVYYRAPKDGATMINRFIK